MPQNTDKTGPRRVIVDAEEAERRLDNFLLVRLKGVPRSRVYRMIRTGEVRVNSRRARPHQRLETGDQVRIPPAWSAAQPHKAGVPSAGWIEQTIIYEDKDLLVLNKPAGLAVHGGSGINFGAIELLRAARSSEHGLELVHRLDRDTSGCLLVARRRSSLRRLHEQFRAGDVQKRYTALLLGELTGSRVNCDASLLTTQRRGGERHVRVDQAGKTALSRFYPEKYLGHATLTTIEIVTGRTHQIRVHAAHLGHPVAGDTRYGRDDDPVVTKFGLKRLFLHAATLAFKSPREDRVIRVEAPMDEKLTTVISRMTSAVSKD
jgi:23S rRNA pseudouridine955/2504/2580 synthase